MNWNRIISLSKRSLLSFLVMSSVNVFVARIYGASERGNLARMTLVLIVVQFLTEKGLLGSLTVHSNLLKNRSHATSILVRKYVLRRLALMAPVLAIFFVWILHWMNTAEFILLLISQLFVTWYQANTFILQGEDIETWNKYFLFQAILYAVVVAPIMLLGLNVVFVIFTYNMSFVLVGYLAKLRLERDESLQELRLSWSDESKIMNYSSRNFLWIMANQLLNRTDLLLFSMILSSVELGVYSVSLSLSMIVSPIFQSVGNIGFVEGSHLDRNRITTYLESMSRKYFKITLIVFMPVNIVGFLIYWFLLRDEYSDIVKLMPLTFVFVATKLFVQALAQILRSSGEIIKAVRIQVLYVSFWLGIGVLIASVISDFIVIMEVMSAMSLISIFALVHYLRRSA